MTTITPKAKWHRGPSPKDGLTYRTRLTNCIDDQWESVAIADPTAGNGWRNGKWQDGAKEVKAWMPIPAIPSQT